MSDPITHECGIALIRLRKPLAYYEERYGNVLYGFEKLFLLMEKQRNRGQDGAGIGAVKLDMAPGQNTMFRDRQIDAGALGKIFSKERRRFGKLIKKGEVIPGFSDTAKKHFPYAAEVLLGHLRYGTSGEFKKHACHPYLRESNWLTRALIVMGNFNMTNTPELNRGLIERGQHPVFDTDTQTILEEIGYHLDEEHTSIYRDKRREGVVGREIPDYISDELDLVRLFRQCARVWDGGYVIGGALGTGESFVMRDPHGIRPCFYYADEEVYAFASERAPLCTVFDLPPDAVQELEPGSVAVIKPDGSARFERFCEERPRAACSFERIYFSRGNDTEIYQERKALGKALAPRVLARVDYDYRHTVFSYIPNTAEIAYYGLVNTLRATRRKRLRDAILKAHEEGTLNEESLDAMVMENWPRMEKIANKDEKLRTFISQEKSRGQMVPLVYDITYGVVRPEDTLVVLDDSIVRGTTLKNSVIKILARTNPQRIIIVSTAPQIRYPDCYGIDMASLGKFIAFQAAIALLREQGRDNVIDEVGQQVEEELAKPVEQQINAVRRIYEELDADTISAKISALVRPTDIAWQGELEILFQNIEDLHEAVPNHRGDWYFTGHYPTPGGTAVCNRAFRHWYTDAEGKGIRPYDMDYVLAPSMAE